MRNFAFFGFYLKKERVKRNKIMKRKKKKMKRDICNHKIFLSNKCEIQLKIEFFITAYLPIYILVSMCCLAFSLVPSHSIGRLAVPLARMPSLHFCTMLFFIRTRLHLSHSIHSLSLSFYHSVFEPLYFYLS